MVGIAHGHAGAPTMPILERASPTSGQKHPKIARVKLAPVPVDLSTIDANTWNMTRLSAPIRSSVVLGLVFSLLAAGIAPAWMTPLQAAGVSGTLAGKKTCCCGTKDGRCCGMACCKVAPPQEEQKTPSVPRPGDDRTAPHCLAHVQQPVRAPSSTAFLQAAGREVAASGSPSLVALHVQMNC